MNTHLIASSLMAAAIAMPCFADQNASGEVGYIPPFPSAPSTLTRAEVIAELSVVQPTPEPSKITRAQVIAELQQAQRDGTMVPAGEGADIGATMAAAARLAPMAAQPQMAAR